MLASGGREVDVVGGRGRGGGWGEDVGRGQGGRAKDVAWGEHVGWGRRGHASVHGGVRSYGGTGRRRCSSFPS